MDNRNTEPFSTSDILFSLCNWILGICNSDERNKCAARCSFKGNILI